MKILHFNNIIIFFLFRYLLLLILCSLTLYITGKLADMNFLLGYADSYGAGGARTQIAKNAFSYLADLGNSYLIIGMLGIILSLILFYLIKNFIDRDNKTLWATILLSPGLLIYSNAPTKETLFLYPAIIYIIIECDYLIGKNANYIPKILIKIGIIFWLILIRGDQALPYLLVSLFSIILKNIHAGKMSNKIKIKECLFYAFIISFILNLLLPIFFPATLNTLTNNVGSYLSVYANIYRPDSFVAFGDPFRFLQNQYLSLFPTIFELISSPHKSLIILDSLMLIYAYIKSWSNLFESINSYKIFKKITFLIFSLITVIYFSSYGVFGSINLGSSQRFKVNFIPLAIFLPLILEKKLRDRKANLYINNQ